MPKPLLLLVDSDARSSRVLRVSLEQAGYEIATAADGDAALSELRRAEPAVVLTATALPKLDGYSLVRQMREHESWRAIPVVFFTDKTAIEDRIRGLELGVEHYLAKPIYVRELLSLVGSLVARRLLVRIEQGAAAADGVVSGSLADLSMLDLLHSLERGRATGLLRLIDGRRRGEIVVRDGNVCDARFERLRGEEAVFRALVWPRGKIELSFEAVPGDTTITRPTAKLVDAALGYITDWSDVVAQLPGLGVAMCIDLPALRQRVGEIPDQLQGVLQLLDGRHELYDVIDESPFDDLSTLQTIGRLYQEGLATAVPVGPDASGDMIGRRPQSDAPVEGRRRTNPWLDGAEPDAKAVAPDAEAVSEELVAAPLAKLEPGSPKPAPRAVTTTPKGPAEPSAATAVAEAGKARDFDEKVADQAVDSLLGTLRSSSPEPGGDGRVIVTAAKTSKQPSSARTRTLASPPPPEVGARDTTKDATATSAADAAPTAAAPFAAAGDTAPGAHEGAGTEERAAVVPGETPPKADAGRADASPEAPSAKVDDATASSTRREPTASSASARDGQSTKAGSAPSPASLHDTLGQSGSALGASSAGSALGQSGSVLGASSAGSALGQSGSALGASSAGSALGQSGSALGASASERALGRSGSTPSSRDPQPRGKRPGRDRPRGAQHEPRGPSSVDSSRARGERASDAEETSPESLRALGESGVSEAFLRSAPAEGDADALDEAPFSEPRPAPLSPEQQARRRRLMRVVGAVVGLAVAVMAFIYLRDPGRQRAAKPPASGSALATRGAPSAPTATFTAAATAASSPEVLTAAATEPDGGPPDDAGADAAGVDGGADAAAGDEPLPEVADPLGEVRKLANAGKYHESIPMAKAAIKADPDNAEPYMYLAEAYRALGKHPEMQAAYDDCVARATKSVGMWCPYGHKKK